MVKKLDFGRICGLEPAPWLSSMYWDIYCIINEQGKTIRETWDGVNLMFTFRRTVNTELMNQWCKLLVGFSFLKMKMLYFGSILHRENTLCNLFML
jgi:hypothetical protein